MWIISEDNKRKVCVNCFILKKNRKIFRKYRIIEKQNYPLFKGEKEWTACEELILHDAISLCGFGNWQDIT